MNDEFFDGLGNVGGENVLPNLGPSLGNSGLKFIQINNFSTGRSEESLRHSLIKVHASVHIMELIFRKVNVALMSVLLISFLEVEHIVHVCFIKFRVFLNLFIRVSDLVKIIRRKAFHNSLFLM